MRYCICPGDPPLVCTGRERTYNLTAMSDASNPFPQDRYRNVEGILRVVRDNLCHRCGACVGVCPVGTFGMDRDGYPIQVAPCINCNICVQSCSGLEVDYDAIGSSLFGPEYRYGELLGTIRRACIGYAAEPEIRQRGASGGVVTQLLVHLLETGKIRGALVAAEDPEQPARGRGLIARTREQLLSAAQSRYTTTPSLHALYDIREEEGPFAMVGLPCQIHSLRKRQMVDPRWKTRVPIAIGLVCHYTLPMDSSKLAAALMTPEGAEVVHAQFREKSETGWPHNTLEMTFSNGTKWRSPHGPKETFNIMAMVSSLGRCLTCLDAGAEFSDLTVGDPWIRSPDGNWKYEEAEGLSAVMIRTQRGMGVVDGAVAAGKLVLRDIPVEDVHDAWDGIARDKKIRVGLRMKAKRLTGQSVPHYQVPFPSPDSKLVREELVFWMLRGIPVFRPLRKLMVRFWFSRAGVSLMRRILQRKKRRAARKTEGPEDGRP